MTLHHPHGQIYAYPFVPPIPARELAAAARALRRARHAACSSDCSRDEIADGAAHPLQGRAGASRSCRCARATRTRCGLRRGAPAPSVADARLRTSACDLARALKTVLLKFDRLWRQPVSVRDGRSTRRRPTAQRIRRRICTSSSIRRTGCRGRLKYLAGSELGAGVFTADTLPEEKAAELRAVDVASD